MRGPCKGQGVQDYRKQRQPVKGLCRTFCAVDRCCDRSFTKFCGRIRVVSLTTGSATHPQRQLTTVFGACRLWSVSLVLVSLAWNLWYCRTVTAKRAYKFLLRGPCTPHPLLCAPPRAGALRQCGAGRPNPHLRMRSTRCMLLLRPLLQDVFGEVDASYDWCLAAQPDVVLPSAALMNAI